MALTASAVARDDVLRASGALTLTAAVCTRGRPALLRRALESLTRQSAPPSTILVVDDARPGEPDAAAVAGAFPSALHVRAPGRGLDVARNLALTHADTDIVAFLDDDAVADPQWARWLRATFVDARAGVCTGRVEPLTLDAPGQALFEANGGYARGARRIELPRDADVRLHGLPAPLIAWAVSIGSGCSLAVRRAAALDIGGFDEHLDDGDALPGGGDHDMIWRLLREGWSAIYEPEALAWHEHRQRADDAIEQIAVHQRALVAFLTKSFAAEDPDRKLPIAAFIAWRLVKPGVRLIRRAFGRDPLPARALLRIWRECVRGLIAYRGAR